jgi:hypothetical protein
MIIIDMRTFFSSVSFAPEKHKHKRSEYSKLIFNASFCVSAFSRKFSRTRFPAQTIDSDSLESAFSHNRVNISSLDGGKDAHENVYGKTRKHEFDYRGRKWLGGNELSI